MLHLIAFQNWKANLQNNTICEVLESNPSMAVNRLDEDERTKFNLGRLQNKRFAELQNDLRERKPMKIRLMKLTTKLLTAVTNTVKRWRRI